MTHLRTVALDSRRTAVLGRLRTALQKECESFTLDELTSEVELLDRIRPLLLHKPPRWLWPTLVASIILIILSLGLAIRVETATVNLDAQATSFALAFGASSPELLGTITPPAGGFKLYGDYQVDGVEQGAPESSGAGPQSVSGMRISDSSVIRFTRTGDRITLTVDRGSVAGHLSYAPPVSGSRTLAKQLVIRPGGAVSFPISARFLLEATNVESIVVSDPHRRDVPPPELHLPSLVKGTLKIELTDRLSQLGADARLRLNGISHGHSLIRAAGELQIIFSGEVREAELFGLYGPELAREANLRPTLFDIAMSWPLLASILAAISAISATLLGLRKTWLEE